ncbi:ESPR-type extended signal peptide-containing protein [Acidaminococcus massiliensis]|uniref:ESPR-type extended signal peptide-containing protein n=1 Tax=Acidaminococcus massiliensis TaxID=1852375 RepID=UPI0023F36895|nr:ESPR-type extended signal peptide-containing protein [Acidaminococcus massiliensis]
MNKIYKVIWSRAKNCYVVVSELAGSHVKNNSGNRTKVLASAVLTMSLLASFPADSLAADTATGAGAGVAYGTGSNAPKAENVAIGKGATISYQGGVGQPSTGDIAIGGGARTLNYIDQGGGIAIGMNAFVENMVGGLERSFDFNQAGYNSIFGMPYGLPKDPTKMVTGLAIGQNTYARSGSVMLGTHNYKGALGDITVDTASTKSYNMSLFSTTLGANSFSNGLFSSVTGAYSIASSDYNTNTFAAGKNFGATITGALNSIESATASSSYAGVANSIVGTANREFNSNGALIFGAGNEITNSITDISAPTSSGDSAQALQKTLMASVKKSESGGATLAIGGGNKADYTQKTSIIGVNNTVTGTSGSVSRYNMVNGYKNTASNVQHVSVIGSGNTVKDTDTALLLGDNRTLSGAANSLVIGSADNVTTTDQQNVVVLGHNANATVAGGVALGSGSLAAVEAGFAGYDPSTRQASTDTSSAWVATGAAVSVGKGTELTRQITSVAAGTQDTDAVNVAQLKQAFQAAAEAGKHSIVSAGDNISVQNTAGAGEAANYQVSLKKDITVDSVTAQTVSVGGIQLNQGNSGTIGGLQNTTWDPDQIVSGQAATEDQLKAVTANVVSYDDASHSSITLNQGGSSTVIKNVGDGSVAEGSKEAVNGGQLYRTNQAVEKNAGDIRNLGSSVNKLGSRLNRVGAGAAALAALHPQDFDPDDKWDFAAGYGNYKDAHAAAIGAFYRPSEDTLISVGGSFGGGENMVNAGVTFKLGQHNHVTRSKVAMAKEIIDLRATVEMLKNQNTQILQTLKLQGTPAVKPLDGNFSDVPETHWAYQYVEGLRERGYLQGYPDGEFKGDRTMTRYEYAAIIYRALQNGAPVDAGMARSVEEFKPELTQVQEAERFRVDRISGKDNDRHKVERVRVNSKENKEKKEYRDGYGSRIQRNEK